MRPSFDHKAFIENEEDGQKLYEKYKKETPVELITLKIASSPEGRKRAQQPLFCITG